MFRNNTNVRMYHLAFFVITSFWQTAAADVTIDYQKIINKQFPDFVILPNSEIDFSHADMSRTEVEKVQATAHLLLVNFNNDGIPDFVAKVRSRDKKIYPKSENYPGYEYYSAGTVACVSKQGQGYQCEFLRKTPTFKPPDRNYLVRIPKGSSMSCHHENYMDPYSGKTGVTSFNLQTDAVGDLRMMGLGDSFYIPRPNGGFFECTASD